MITVRFSTGVSITYNSATQIDFRNNGGIQLVKKDEQGKLWLVAEISPGTQCVFEYVKPCTFENPIEGVTIEGAVKLLVNNEAVRKAPSYWVCRLKEILQEFNRKTNRWRETV